MSRFEQQRPRIGLIGISGFASVHAELLLEAADRGDLAVEAVVILPVDAKLETAERLRAGGARLYEDYRSFMEAESGKLDLCVIPTGIPWHARMIIAALEAEMQVLVEKPLAGCLADARAIQEAERRTGRWVAVAYQDFYTETVQWLAKELSAGCIGQLESISFLALWPRTAEYYGRNAWAGRERLEDVMVRDSALNNAFTHYINLSLYLSGSPARPVIESAELLRAHDIDTFDTAVVTARIPDGPRLWFGGSQACRSVRDPEILIKGSKGTASWRFDEACRISPDKGPEASMPVPGGDAARREMLQAVLARLGHGDGRICDTETATRPVAFIEDLHSGAMPARVPPGLIRQEAVAGTGQKVPAMENIDTSLIEAFKKGCLLREVSMNLFRIPTSRESLQPSKPRSLHNS